MKTAPTFVDLFCGAGLMSQGFVAAGFRPVLAVDSNEDSVASYRRNIDHVAQVGDVRNIPAGLRCQVVVAGPPCQGFSLIGKRDPLDPRNRMCLVVPVWARETKCDVVVVENVPQFVQSIEYKTMIGDLEKQGFAVKKWVLNAADFGTPQKRKRSFTVASKIDLPNAPVKQNKKATVREAFRNLPSQRNDPLHAYPEPSPLAMERFINTPSEGSKIDIMKNAPDICLDSWFSRGAQTTDVWGRMRWDEPSNTVRCYFQNPTTGRYVHPEKNRVITLREGARLQDVPDRWIFEGKRTSIVKQIGNGVPVNLAKTIGENIKNLFIS